MNSWVWHWTTLQWYLIFPKNVHHMKCHALLYCCHQLRYSMWWECTNTWHAFVLIQGLSSIHEAVACREKLISNTPVTFLADLRLLQNPHQYWQKQLMKRSRQYTSMKWKQTDSGMKSLSIIIYFVYPAYNCGITLSSLKSDVPLFVKDIHCRYILLLHGIGQ